MIVARYWEHATAAASGLVIFLLSYFKLIWWLFRLIMFRHQVHRLSVFLALDEGCFRLVWEPYSMCTKIIVSNKMYHTFS
jgi:hypothetical protein